MCIAQMEIEHAAWRRLCKCLEVLTSESVNDQKYRPLVAFIRLWGEELAVLRRDQGENGITWGRKARCEESAELAKQGIMADYSA